MENAAAFQLVGLKVLVAPEIKSGMIASIGISS